MRLRWRPGAWRRRARRREPGFIERTFGETRRRTKVIGRLPGETSCLTLVWAVLDRASRGWRGLIMTATASASCRTCVGRCPARPAGSGPAPQPEARTAAPGRVSASLPDIAMYEEESR